MSAVVNDAANPRPGVEIDAGTQTDADAIAEVPSGGVSTRVQMDVRNICKRFGGVVALDDVSLTFEPGMVHAVVGENGAGKSTLMKIMAGVLPADRGQIHLNGQPVHFRSVRDAMAAGVSLIHQELNLAGNLDIGGNLFLGRESLRPGWPRMMGWMDRDTMNRAAVEQLHRVGLDVDPRLPLSTLSIGNQQLVEIAKALSVGSRVLIMDEPTSSLTLKETDRLMEVIDSLRDDGVTVLYITHRMPEIDRIANHVWVLRDGKNAGQLSADEMTREKIIRLMVGRDLEFATNPGDARHDENGVQPTAPPVTEVCKAEPASPDVRGGDDADAIRIENFRTLAHPDHAVSFELVPGQVVGMAGLVGAGRTELLRAVFGADRRLEGRLLLAGRSIEIAHPRDAAAEGVVMVPEDRKLHGVLLESSIRGNLALPNLRSHRRGPFVRDRQHRRDSGRVMEQLRIKAPDDRASVGSLSGGNQQKVALGKWLVRTPRLLLLDEPTRGVDVGAKAEIYRLIRELADRGVAILFASGDMEEIFALADRVLVMHDGRVMADRGVRQMSETSIMRAAVGRADAAEGAA